MSEIVVEIQEPKKNHGCLKALGIGCLVVIVLAVVGGFFAYKGFKGIVSKLANNYTDTTPVELLMVDASEDEIVETLNRFDDFANSLEDGKKLPELVLTSKDINILIQKNEDFDEAANSLYVNIKGDRIHADVSISLDKLGEVTNLDDTLKGRYLNGSVVFQVGMAVERLVVNIDSITVDDKKVPSTFIQAINNEGIGNKFHEDKDVAKFLDKIHSIKIKDDKLYIIPK